MVVLEELNGRKFKYMSPHGGLSDWTATIKNIGCSHSMIMDPDLLERARQRTLEEGDIPDDITIGHQLKFTVYCEENYNHYDLNDIVILNKKKG